MNETKFVYQDEQGRKLHAGGLLFYDDEGIWVIKEFYKDSYRFSDPGGKYKYEDCNIFATIAREFSEETYFSEPFTYTDLLKVIENKKCELVFVCPDKSRNPTYLCILINLEDVKPFKLNTESVERFVLLRNKALSENPRVPERYYSSFELKHLKYEDIPRFSSYFSFRLKHVFQRTFLKTHLKEHVYD